MARTEFRTPGTPEGGEVSTAPGGDGRVMPPQP